MSDRFTCDVLVWGAGLDGADAAVQAAAEGASVVVADEGPGRTALWSGVFDVYGPTAPPAPEQLPIRFRRGALRTSVAVEQDAGKRLAWLAGQSPSHAYADLDFDAQAVRDAFAARVERLSLPGTLHATPVPVATNAGTVRWTDFTADGVAVLDAPATFLGLDAWPNWSPEWAARTAQAHTGLAFESAWLPADGALVESTLALVSQCTTDSDAFAARIASVAKGLVVLPALLGVTNAQRAAAQEALSEVGVDARELASPFDSPFGLRLAAHLRKRVDAVARRVGNLRGLPERAGPRVSDGWIVSVDTPSGPTTVACKRLVAALDAHVPPSWAEPWRSPSPRFPRNAADSPWAPHAFLNRPVEVPC